MTAKLKTIHTREYHDNGEWRPLSDPWVSDGLLGYKSAQDAQQEILRRNKTHNSKPYLNGVEYVHVIGPSAALSGGAFRHRIYFVR